jgi:hypothetical protein
MTNNNNTKPGNCACYALTCESFVAGNQCFRCEEVDNREAGIVFDGFPEEMRAYIQKGERRIETHRHSPDYREATGFCADRGNHG